MTLLGTVQRTLQLAGVEVSRHSLNPVAKALRHHSVDTVIDVGANRGQYARTLRRLGYGGAIVSFEPVEAAYSEAVRRASRDSRWSVHPYALGNETAEVQINVAANRAASSSVLTMLPSHEAAAPEALIVAQEVVQQRRLDDVWPEFVGAGTPAFLKIDVQGYERHVLDGAQAVLAEGLVIGLQLELSYVELYEGAWMQADAVAWAGACGFELYRLIPGFSDPVSGRMLQADGVFLPS